MRKNGKMKLLELVILKGDVNTVLEYLGKSGNFQMYKSGNDAQPVTNSYKDKFDHLKVTAKYLGIATDSLTLDDATFPTNEELKEVEEVISQVTEMEHSFTEINTLLENALATYNEASAFSRLNLPYNEVDSLTFLTIRMGHIPAQLLDSLRFAVGSRALIVPINEDGSKIVAASSKKGRFALDSELKKVDFVPIEINKNFKGMPNDVLEALTQNIKEKREQLKELEFKLSSYATENKERIILLLKKMSLAYQAFHARYSLDEAQEVYRLRGWVSSYDVKKIVSDLQKDTQGRIAIQTYEPFEVSEVKDGNLKVPVHYKHNAFVQSFERMVFSYGIPLYGTIDPTPIVAIFFTLLFGIMFGDAGQGALILLAGLFLRFSYAKILKDWKRFSYVFIAMGSSSMFMGFLTGEVFTNNTLLIPLTRHITSFFGAPQDHILHLMPKAGAVNKLMYFFAFTMFIGFIINSLGIVINIVNNIRLNKIEKAILGKFGLVGLVFFWYVVFLFLRLAFIGNGTSILDAIVISSCIFLVFFEHSIIRIVKKEKPILENGLFASIIQGFVGVLELLSTFISNSVSFLRVGAFALSHAVLSFIVFTLTDLVGGYLSLGLLVSIFGNLIIILLESLIVTIQVVRLQYYEFFSKFFTETGVEFTPFKFKYQE